MLNLHPSSRLATVDKDYSRDKDVPSTEDIKMAHSGEAHHYAKLTDDKVRRIRRLRAVYGYTIKELAELFEVGKTTIRDVLARHTWKHVYGHSN